MRDIVQNHVMQVMCLTAMEPPVTFDAESVREEKVKVLKAVRPIPEDEVENYAVRGQYTRGWIFGEEVPGYREEEDVAPDSCTDTYVALKLFVDNWRWAGTPIYVRAGKRLPKKVTEIAIQFRPTPHTPFARGETQGLEPNVLVIRIQPEEGISLKIGAKVPGSGFEISSVNMDLLYGTAFLEEAPDAYQRLLLDLMLGDPTLFIRADEAEYAWSILEPVMRAWSPPTRPGPGVQKRPTSSSSATGGGGGDRDRRDAQLAGRGTHERRADRARARPAPHERRRHFKPQGQRIEPNRGDRRGLSRERHAVGLQHSGPLPLQGDSPDLRPRRR
jgi:glucose-6-phosphate 1-dehydrogenase